MSDNLENLSNAELRAKCIELGLPNIPITDTSRNVIIKRLRTTLLGGVSSPAVKKTNRRETIAVVAERASPAKPLMVAAEKVGDVKSVSEKRRTIATAANEETATKIPERRTSVRASPAPKSVKERRTPTMVVLDSEEEDEVVAAAQKAEQQQTAINTRRSTSRQPSLSRSTTTTTTTTEFKGLTAVAEESPSLLEKIRAKEVEEQKLRRQQEQLRSKQEKREQMLLKQQQEEKERLINHQRVQKQIDEARLRYNAANRKPVQMAAYVPFQRAPQLETAVLTPTNVAPVSVPVSVPAPASVPAPIQAQAAVPAPTRYSQISPPIYKPKSSLYPQLDTVEPTYNRATYATRTPAYNDFSDDTDTDVGKVGVDSDEEKFNTPFLSEFARNLNRLKAEPLSGGDLTRRYTRSRTAHEVKGRVAMPRYGQEDGQDSLWENLVILNNRFHLLRHIFLVSIIILVVYIFFKFWQ